VSMYLYGGMAVLFWGASVILDKLALRYTSATGAFYGRMLFTMLCFLPLVAHKMYAVKQPFLGLSKTAVLFVFASVIVTNIGVFCYIKSLSLGEASRIAPLTSTYPLIAMLLAIFILGEKLTILKLLGAGLVSAGIWCLAL